MRRRAYLNVLRDGPNGKQLLVFRHKEKRLWQGIQTPGGTIEPGEDVLAGAKREAFEETGFDQFSRFELIATDHFTLVNEFEGTTEELERFYFSVELHDASVDEWTHKVGGSGVDGDMEFTLFWIDLPEASELESHFRDYLERCLC